jgi:hypothetical protein
MDVGLEDSRRLLFRQTFGAGGDGEETNERGGYLSFRNKYKFIDLSVTYTTEIIKRHRFTFRQGLSFATGQDHYLYSILHFQAFLRFYSEIEKGKYFGGVSDLTYDYSFWSRRINVGVNAGARYYFGLPWVNYSYGMHIAYCF